MFLIRESAIIRDKSNELGESITIQRQLIDMEVTNEFEFHTFT